jgi:23S rRNA (uracil1939-C5)-methyltransferase
MLGTNAYFCAMAKKNTDKVVFHQIKVIDGAKGVSVAKALMAKLYNVVPGDVIDVTLKAQVLL